MATSKQERDALYAALGKLIVHWNELEFEVQYLVLELCEEGSYEALILTAHMGNVSLLDALRTLANEQDEFYTQPKPDGPEFDPIAPHVTHLITCVERLREYRNLLLPLNSRTGPLGLIGR